MHVICLVTCNVYRFRLLSHVICTNFLFWDLIMHYALGIMHVLDIFTFVLVQRSLACLTWKSARVCLFVGCLTSQQQASVSQGRICLDNFTCCHTEIEVADQTFYLTQSQYTDTGPTSPSADPITPGAWQGSHRSANF